MLRVISASGRGGIVRTVIFQQSLKFVLTVG